MKKKALVAFLSLALLLALPLPASAAGATEGQTQIYYIFSGLRTAPVVSTPSPSPVISYEVNIPATYCSRTDPCLAITASKVDIGAGKLLTVSVDWEKTFDENGFFFLTNTEKPKYKAMCSLYRSNAYGIVGEWMSSPDYALAAAFEDGNTTPVSFGYIVANTTADDTTIDGTYTGTIYFQIELQDAP